MSDDERTRPLMGHNVELGEITTHLTPAEEAAASDSVGAKAPDEIVFVEFGALTQPSEQGLARNGKHVARDPNGHWVPGASGNPGGRPKKGESLGERMRALLSEEGSHPGSTKGAELIQAIYTAATSKEPYAVRAMELWLDRIDGKVALPIEVSQVTLVLGPGEDVP